MTSTRLGYRVRIGRVHGEYFKDNRCAGTVMEASRFIDPDRPAGNEVDAIVATEQS